MNHPRQFIRAVLVVFWLLVLSRIPAFMNGTLDPVTAVSTIVELGFFTWGVLILRNDVRKGSATHA
jgi:hypothetical protein